MPLTVTQLVEAINTALSVLEDVEVEGEVDEFKIIHNKWVTFQLKDEGSAIGCFMTVWQYRTQVEDGMLVRVKGRPALRNKGFFSFVLSSIQPSGEGALKRTFELLRQKLEREGLFAPERKRPLPRFPEHVVLITSRDGAAYSDFIKVLQGRQGGLTISFIHTQVQGEDAPRQVMAALEQANTSLENVDVIIMVRGGGSLEDLHAFNDEAVVRAVAGSRLPTIVGIGHERDVTLAELAADLRASTPSNAAELLVHSRQELELGVSRMQARLSDTLHNYLRTQMSAIAHGVNILRSRTNLPRQRVARQLESLSGFQARLHQTLQSRAEDVRRLQSVIRQYITDNQQQSHERLVQLSRVLHTLSPAKTLKRGYSITRTTKGKVVKAAAQLAVGEVITTQFADGRVKSTVSGTDTQQPFSF